MIFNQTDHILANGSFTIPDGSDAITIRVPAFKRTPPSLILTPIGPNANVNLFVDDTSSTYSPISYDLTEAFETKNGRYKFAQPAEAWGIGPSGNSFPNGGLQGWWRLNENVSDGGNFADSSANARTGTTSVGFTPTFVDRMSPSTSYIQGGSCSFPGGPGPNATGVNLGQPAIWDKLIGDGLGATAKMSFSMWVYLEDWVGKFYTFGENDITAYPLTAFPGEVFLRARWTSPTNPASYITDDTPLELGKWHHLAITYDATGPPMYTYPKVYVDGEERNVINYGTMPTGTYMGISTYDSYLGNSYSTYAFNGKIADFAVWNRIISAEDIKAIYDVSVAGVIDDGVDGHTLTIKRSSDAGELTVQWQAIAADPVRVK